ncbi:MAG TPA: DUF4157 domain-containing protein [Kofleriaceae bacterium]|jgi:hypothetical protein|nr:DUF4157 domain-containing protein [Kofleriaceae bacterium]
MGKRSRFSDETEAPSSFRSLAPGRVPATVHLARAASSSGAQLPADVQTRFEGSLGADLAAVRVHTGADSAAAARSIGAKAYTIGNDIHFAEGRYQPLDPFGLHLLAHEVAHTQQQAGGAASIQPKLEISAPGDASEHDADRAADAMVRGDAASVTRGAPQIAREADADLPSIYDHGDEARDGGEDRIQTLKRNLEDERRDNLDVAHAMRAATDAIDEKAKTATGDEKTQLLAKKAELAPKQAAAEKKAEQAAADLKTLERGPDVKPQQLNDVLARRNVLAAGSAPQDVEAKSSTDSMAAKNSFTVTKTDNEVLLDGTSQTRTNQEKTDVGINGASYAQSDTTKNVKGETTTTDTSSKSTSVDWKEGKLSSSSTDSTLTEQGEKKQGTSNTKTTTVDATGVTHSDATTVTKDRDKTTETSTGGITRGDGQLGTTATQKRETENENGAKTSVSTTSTKGLVDAKDGVGVYGSEEGAASKRTASGLECSAKAKAGGRAVINIRKVEGADPVKYEVAITISLSVSGGFSAGGGSKDDPAATSGGKASVGLSGSASAVASYGHQLDEAQTKAWLDAVAAAEAGNGGAGPEMQIIACGMTKGWAAAKDLWESMGGSSGRSTNDLADGDSSSLDLKTTEGGNASLSGKNGGSNIGLEGSMEKSHEVKGYTRRTGDKTITSFLITDGSNNSAGGSAGTGVASFGMSHKWGDSSGVGYTFFVKDSTPNASGLRSELDAIRTKSALESFAAAHRDLMMDKTTTDGTSSEDTEKINVGPAELSMTSGGKFNEMHKEEYDDDGKIKKETDQYTGDSTLGGQGKVFGLGAGSNSDEQIDAKVVSERQADGTFKKTASADASKTDTSSSPDFNGSLEGVLDHPVDALTGNKPLIKQDEKKEVAGVFLNDHDFDTIIALAEKPEKWNRSCERPANLDDWEACRVAVHNAHGDKKLVAEALAKFGGGGEHGRSQMIGGLVGADEGGGGVRYDFPDGLGDQKAEFGALVVNDPTPAVEELAKTDLPGAADQAKKLADRCDSLANKMTLARDKFTNPDIFSDMLTRVTNRATDLRGKVLTWNAKASGKEIDPDLLDKSKAATKWSQMLDLCRANVAEEQKYFDQISAAGDDPAKVVPIVNQLKALHKRWRPQYDTMAALAQQYEFGANDNWKGMKPDETRLALCDPGRFDKGQKVVDPNSDEAHEAQAEANAHARQVSEQNREAGAALMESTSATVGMKRRADGSYYGEYTPEQQKQQDLKQAEEVRGRVKEQYASWESTIASLRADAVAAKGKCNKLTSGGSWDGVKKDAQRAYNQGFASFNEAESAWKAAQAAANAPGTGVLQFYPKLNQAKGAYVECAEKFKEGDQLQG